MQLDEEGFAAEAEAGAEEDGGRNPPAKPLQPARAIAVSPMLSAYIPKRFITLITP